MKKLSPIGIFVILVAILPVTGFALFSYYEYKWQPLPVLGQRQQINGHATDYRIGDFQLQDQDGNNNTAAQWKGKIVVADFFFTHCATICPKMTIHLRKVQDRYRKDDNVVIRSFSVDPERDSVAQLKNYAVRFGVEAGKWNLLTGDKKTIYRLARNGFQIVATDGDGGPNDFIHSEKLVLVDRQQRIRGYYDGTDDKETDQLINDIKKLEHEK